MAAPRAPLYLLSGEEFLAGEALERLRSQLEVDSLSESAFDPKAPLHDIMGALETGSLLGGSRLVIVNDVQDLPKESVDALLRYIENPSDSTVLVLVAGARSKLDAAAKKKGALIALEAPKGRRLAAWTRERAATKGLKMDDRAAWALLDSVGNELRDLDGALEQLLDAHGPGARIGPAEVHASVSRTVDERIYAFTDAVGDRRLDVAMSTLRRLLDQGEEPLMIFGALTGQLRRMLRAHRHAERGPAAVSDALGLPGWRAERLARQARSYREDELSGALALLARVDVELKGELPPEGKVATLEGAVVRILGDGRG